MAPKRWFTWLGWTLFALALTGIGIAIHIVLPPLPRWTVHGEDRPGHVSADGTTLITYVQKWRRDDSRESEPSPPIYSGPVEAWDAATGRLRGSFFGNAEFPEGLYHQQIAYGQKQAYRYLTLALDDKTVAIADTLTGQEMKITLPTHAGLASNMAELSNGALFESAGCLVFRDSTDFHIVEASSGKLLDTLQTAEGSIGQTKDSFFYFAPTEEGLKRQLVIWSFAECRVTRSLPKLQYWPQALSPDEKSAWIYMHPIWVRAPESPRHECWDLRTGMCRILPEMESRTILFSPDSRTIALSDNKSIDLWNEADLQKRATLQVGEPILTRQFLPEIHFSPDSRFIALLSGDAAGPCTLSLWDVETGQRRWARDAGKDHTFAIEFSSDSQTLAHCKRDEVDFLEVADGTLRSAVSIKKPEFTQRGSTQFIRGGDYVASGGPYSRVKKSLWEEWLGTWSPIKDRRDEGVVVVAHMATGKELLRLYAEMDLTPIYVSPDGDALITSSNSTIFQAWDIPSRPRWGWVAGIPLGLGLLLMMIKWWLGRRRIH